MTDTVGERLAKMRADLAHLTNSLNADESFADALVCQAAVVAVDKVIDEVEVGEFPWDWKPGDEYPEPRAMRPGS